MFPLLDVLCHYPHSGGEKAVVEARPVSDDAQGPAVFQVVARVQHLNRVCAGWYALSSSPVALAVDGVYGAGGLSRLPSLLSL